MTILEKIQSAQSKKDLDILTQEIIFSADYKANIEAFKKRLNELTKMSTEGKEG